MLFSLRNQNQKNSNFFTLNFLRLNVSHEKRKIRKINILDNNSDFVAVCNALFDVYETSFYKHELPQFSKLLGK